MWISVGAGYLSGEGHNIYSREQGCVTVWESKVPAPGELQVVFMEAEDCHLLFISLFSLKCD